MTVDAHIKDLVLQNALEVSQAAREQALQLVDLVARATAAHNASNGPLPSELLAEIAKQQKLLNTNLAHLRGLHRQAHFRARETKAQTAERRHEVDVLHLQLQNLIYEQRHLEGEIAACESFEYVPPNTTLLYQLLTEMQTYLSTTSSHPCRRVPRQVPRARRV